MWKIKYNIAQKRQIDYTKFALVAGAVVGLALLFVLAGISNLWSSDKRVRDQKERMEQDRLKLEELVKNTRNYEDQVGKMKGRWRSRIVFANELIDGKNFRLTERLEVIEKNLPEGVTATYVVLENHNPLQIRLNISAHTMPRLIETYKAFTPFNTKIIKETEDGGRFNSQILLTLQKKAKRKKVDAEKDEDKKDESKNADETVEENEKPGKKITGQGGKNEDAADKHVVDKKADMKTSADKKNTPDKKIKQDPEKKE